MKHALSPFAVSALLAVLLLPAQASAQDAPQLANLNVSPLRLEIPTTQQSAQLQVRNHGDQPLPVQVRVFAWSQDGAQDSYVQARDVTISPSIVRIAPGQAQVFHVVPRDSRDPVTQRRYRVVIDELPSGATPAPGTANTRVRMTIPLFTDGELARDGEPVFTVRDGQLVIANEGDRTLRLQDISASIDGVAVNLGPAVGLQYIHGGNAVPFDLPAELECPAGTMRVMAQSDGVAVDAVADKNCS